MSGNDGQRDELYPYRFPKTLTESARFIGLPVDEVILVVPMAAWGLSINKPIFGFVIAGIIWLLVKKAKKGKGSRWLFNLMYWYLPTALFRAVYKRIPDSGDRQWTK